MKFFCLDVAEFLLNDVMSKSEQLQQIEHREKQKILFYIDEFTLIVCAGTAWMFHPSPLAVLTGIALGVGTLFIPKDRWIKRYVNQRCEDFSGQALVAKCRLFELFEKPENVAAFMRESASFKGFLTMQQITEIEVIERKIQASLRQPDLDLTEALREYFFLKKQFEQVLKNQYCASTTLRFEEKEIELEISEIDLKNA